MITKYLKKCVDLKYSIAWDLVYDWRRLETG
jgi:hypothetical protein